MGSRQVAMTGKSVARPTMRMATAMANADAMAVTG